MRGTLFIVSAPSGTGKSSLLASALSELNNTVLSISHTTRPIRNNETDGENYYFVNEQKFLELIEQDAFLEYAYVFGNLYGTARSTVEKNLDNGKHVVLEIDWQGADQIRSKKSDTQSIFIIPPNFQTLATRLRARSTDAIDVISRRLQEARNEIKNHTKYDYLIINADFKSACDQLKGIFNNLKHTNPNPKELKSILDSFK